MTIQHPITLEAIRYLPEVGSPILDRVEEIEQMYQQSTTKRDDAINLDIDVARKRSELMMDIYRRWSGAEIEDAMRQHASGGNLVVLHLKSGVPDQRAATFIEGLSPSEMLDIYNAIERQLHMREQLNVALDLIHG